MFLWLSHEALEFSKNTKFECTHHILGDIDIKPPNSTNNDNMQIITSFSFFAYKELYVLSYNNVLNPHLITKNIICQILGKIL